MFSQLKLLEQERDNLIAINKSLAEYNLSKEPEFSRSKEGLINAHKSLIELRREVEKKREEVIEVSRQASLDTTLALLQTASAESEEESDGIANQLLSSEMNVDTFLTQFLARRKEAHLRRIKTDKLIEYVRDQSGGRSGQNSSISGQNSSSSGHGSRYPVSPIRPAPAPPGGSVPYPVGGIPGMPQPGYSPYHRQPPSYGPR